MSSFFNQLNYSACNEDSKAELLALELHKDSRAAVITGSGARALDLLTQPVGQVHSIDVSEPQNHLLRLKIAGYQRLDHSGLMQLLGTYSNERSLHRFDEIADSLEPDCRQFWEARRFLIEKGILYRGTWEKLLRNMARCGFLRRRPIRLLFEAADIHEQMHVWEKYWNGAFFRTFLKAISNRFLWTNVIREPGAKLIPRSVNIAEYLYTAMERMARRSLLRENPMANLIFFGRYQPGCVLPLHLRPNNFESIKRQVDQIKIHTAGLEDWLSTQRRSINAFSVSDFSSYASLQQYRSTWEAVVQAATDGARFCERLFLVPRILEQQGLLRDQSLEARLHDIDQTCLYTFHAGQIHHALTTD